MLFQWTPYLRTIKPGQYVLFLGMWKRVVKVFPKQNGIVLWLEDVKNTVSVVESSKSNLPFNGGLGKSSVAASASVGMPM